MIFGIGSDLVDIRRIEKTIQTHGQRFLNRVFTSSEQNRIESRKNHPSGYAKLFAAKEAVLKALGTGLTNGIHWTDIEVIRFPYQRPTVQLKGAAETIILSLIPENSSWIIHLSLTDEWPYAQAYAVIEVYKDS
jgi:holo-[acyl-carrier protein] synthase